MQGDVKTQGANNVVKGGPFLASKVLARIKNQIPW